MSFKVVLASIGARLREPSTYAGLAILAGAVFHFTPTGADIKTYTDIGTGIAGVLSIVLREKGQSAPDIVAADGSQITVEPLPPLKG